MRVDKNTSLIHLHSLYILSYTGLKPLKISINGLVFFYSQLHATMDSSLHLIYIIYNAIQTSTLISIYTSHLQHFAKNIFNVRQNTLIEDSSVLRQAAHQLQNLCRAKAFAGARAPETNCQRTPSTIKFSPRVAAAALG